MKKIFCIIALAATVGLTTGCKEEKKRENIIVKKVERKAPSAPVAMQEYVQKSDVEWGGEAVACEIIRKADASLPIVTNEKGQKFVDNKISLKICYKNGGELIFEKSFAKSDFNAVLDDDYRRTGVLEGLVFDKMEDGKMKFAASVSHPQTDEYIPIVLLVSKNGAISMTQDTMMDTNGGEEEEI